MKQIQSTRVKCSTDGRFHKMEFLPDGTVHKDGEDVTEEVRRIAAMARLGRAPADPRSCAALGALVIAGCEAILRRPADEEGYVRDLSGWSAVYTRWETNSVVEATMRRTRRRLKRHAPIDKHPLPKLAGAVA